jgi:hypothetical protein
MIIIPGQSGTYRHSRRRVTDLLAESGLSIATPEPSAQNKAHAHVNADRQPAEAEFHWPGGCSRQPVTVIDPAIESHYGTGYERSRLFRDGKPSLEYVRSMELLDRLLPPPAQLLDVGGGPGTYAAPLARRSYRVHWWIRCRCTWSRHTRPPAAAGRPSRLPWATRESYLRHLWGHCCQES